MVQINLTKKQIYLIAGVIIIISLGFVLAQTIPNPGHSISDLQACSTVGQILKSTGTSWTCGTDVGITSETDPQVGNVTTAGKWCVANGTAVNCDQGAPSSEGISGSGSANYLAKWNGTSTITNSLILYDNGSRLGIGTINPDPLFLLDVNGKARFRDNVQIDRNLNIDGDLSVNGSIYQRGTILCADYVFEKEYVLESIEEHSKYMWANQHLPAVPKAADVVEMGTQMKGILEELEKAHVYIEQLKKENDALKRAFCEENPWNEICLN